MASKPRTHPTSSDLSHEKTWQCTDNRYGPFRAVRFNVILDEVAWDLPRGGLSLRPRPKKKFECFYDQRPIRVLEAAPGMTLGEEVTVGTERTFATLESTLREAIFTTETHQAINAAIDWGGSMKMGASADAIIKDNVRELSTLERRWESKETQTSKVNVDLSAVAEMSRVIQAAPFLKITYDAYLVFADYLEIRYSSTALHLRRQRVKSPPLVDESGRAHQNYRMFNLPLGRYSVYEPLGPQDMSFISPDVFAQYAVDPQRVDRTDIPNPKQHYGVRDFRDIPSLYRISNAAFPLKWQQRSTLLSEAEIFRLYHEVEPETTAWFWEVRRRNRRRG